MKNKNGKAEKKVKDEMKEKKKTREIIFSDFVMINGSSGFS